MKNTTAGGGATAQTDINVLDYVNQKAEEYELAQQKKQLDKKLELTEIAFKKARYLARAHNIHIQY